MSQRKPNPLPDFLTGTGMMGELIARTDWSDHPIGPVEQWPQSLVSTLSVCLHSPFPMAVYWGQEMYLFYNDLWSQFPGDKHPEALGMPAKEVWSDIWHILEPPMRSVLDTGQGYLAENELLPINRKGYTEETYFEYSLNPIFGEDGSVAGMLNIGIEITQRVLNERRSSTLRKLMDKTIIAESPEAACILLANTLTEAPADVPFAFIYLLNSDKKSLRLAASTSSEDDGPFAPSTVQLKVKNRLMPFHNVVRSKQYHLIEDFGKHFKVSGGLWDEPCREAVLLPIIRPHSKEVYGVLLLGISPRLEFDHDYHIFAMQIAEQAALVAGSAYDLRRKLLLEAREHDAQQQLSAALSGGLIGIWSWDIKNNIVTADKNLARRFGVNEKRARQGLPMEKFISSIHPEDRPGVMKKVDQALAQRKRFDAEYRLLGNDGSTRWVIARGRVQTDKSGTPIRFPGIIIDITKRKEVEGKLAESERMFNALFESTSMAVAIAEMDGTVKDANETFLKLFGYTKRDLANGITSEMLTPSKSKSVTKSMYKQLQSRQEFEPTEKDYMRKDGTIVPILVSAVVIPESGGRFISFMLDISEQRHLLALNKAKDEFISIASHQLRTPATGVKQYLGMLLEGYVGKLGDLQSEILKVAYDSNERQLVIINDLLRVAQADASEIKLIKKDTDLASLIRDVIKEQKHKFENLSQRITFNSPQKSIVNASVDSFHLRMVFENLIDNASKYTPEGKEIAVSLVPGKNNVKIHVKDQGVGIRKKDMPKLFKKFSRIDNPLSTPAGGTGLGLYWVHKIVDLHDGVIEVSSEHKKGTEFVITLPTDINKDNHA